MKKVLVSPVMAPSVMLAVPVSPSTSSSAPVQASRPARVTTNAGMRKRVTQNPWKAPMMAPAASRARIAIQPGQRHDRAVDVADPQDQHHPDRDGPGPGELREQVGEVAGGEEAVVGDPEDRPDDRDADDHRQGAELALGQAAPEAGPGAGQAGLLGDQPGVEVGDGHGSLTSVGSCSSPALAPVIAATTSSELVCLASRTPTCRPSRSTTMVSATANTSARLWLITTTARPCSRRVRISSRTCAVWATPRAAVGSSSSTTLGSPSIDRAIATPCRWPPDSDAIWVRTLGIRTASRLRTLLASCSMPVSSSSRTPPSSSRPR